MGEACAGIPAIVTCNEINFVLYYEVHLSSYFCPSLGYCRHPNDFIHIMDFYSYYAIPISQSKVFYINKKYGMKLISWIFIRNVHVKWEKERD